MAFKRWVFIVLVLLLLCTVYADKVILKSGREIIGSIVSTQGDSVIIRDVDNIEYRILKSDVKRVELGVIGTTQTPVTVTGPGPGTQPQQPVVSYDKEDNNSFAKANYLKIGTNDFLTFDGRLFPQRDRDYYYFNVEKAGEYKVKVTGKDQASRPGVRVLNGNTSTLLNWSWAEVGVPQIEITFDQGFLNLGDKVCIEIAQYGDNLVMDYNVQLSVNTISDNYEPNNRFKEAMEIKAHGEIREFIFPKGDRDYYKFDISEAGRLNVYYSHEDVSMRPGMRLISCENSTLHNWLAARDVGKMVEFSHDFAAPEKVYLELNNHGDNRRSMLTYLLKTEFIPVRDVHEPNNRFKEAKMIPVGQTTTAFIFPRGDRDYYKFVVDKPGVLDVKIATKNPLSRLAVRMISIENSAVRNWEAAKENSQEIEFSIELLAGTYLMEVNQYGDNHASLIPYQLDLTLTPSNDPYEPNKSFAEAVEIGLNKPINATIFPRGDRDYYKFYINSPCDLTVDIQSNILLRMAARVVNGNNSTVVNWQTAPDNGKPLNFTQPIKEPGWYIMEIANHGDARGSVIPYQLILTTK
ncbi:MAG: hypothetical protein U9N62_06720 [Thermotogota bacterium]|nr:hypothetical protein [Thermotogota bacterium]